MARVNPEKSNLAPMNGSDQNLSPCLRLLIEILLDEAITTNSEVSAASDIDSGESTV